MSAPVGPFERKGTVPAVDRNLLLIDEIEAKNRAIGVKRQHPKLRIPKWGFDWESIAFFPPFSNGK